MSPVPRGGQCRAGGCPHPRAVVPSAVDELGGCFPAADLLESHGAQQSCGMMVHEQDLLFLEVLLLPGGLWSLFVSPSGK